MKCQKKLLEVWSFLILNVTIFGLEKPLLRSLVVILKHFFKWKLNYPFHSTIKIWAGINTFLLPNKMKELHYKILHMYYPCNSLLSNLSWNSLHNAHSVILTWKQYHIYFLKVIMQTIYENKYLGLFSQLTTNSLVLK